MMKNEVLQKMKIIDISQELLSCKVYEGDPNPKIEVLQSINGGDLYNLSSLSLCLHNGTHIDAPRHFIRDGVTVNEIPISTLVGICYVAEHQGDVTANDVQKILKKAQKEDAAERILLKGDLTVTEEAAKEFAKAGILLLGNESQSVGPENAPMAVHLALLTKGIILLEGIVLHEAKEGKYLLNAAPLNINGAEGSPCRAWLAEI